MPEDTASYLEEGAAEVKEGEEVNLETEEEELEELEEEPEIKDEPDPQTENAERSRLGRRLSKMEKMFEEFMTNFTNFTQKTAETEPSYEEELPLTKKEAREYFAKLQQTQLAEQDKYADAYLDTLEDLGADESDPKFFDEVVKFMKTNTEYNTRQSNNPKADAEANYLKAANAVLRANRGVKKNPLNKNKVKNPKHLGVNGDTKVESKEVIVPELDDYAKRFAAAVGMSEESIKKAFSKDLPVGMKGVKKIDIESL